MPLAYIIAGLTRMTATRGPQNTVHLVRPNLVTVQLCGDVHKCLISFRVIFNVFINCVVPSYLVCLSFMLIIT